MIIYIESNFLCSFMAFEWNYLNFFSPFTGAFIFNEKEKKREIMEKI